MEGAQARVGKLKNPTQYLSPFILGVSLPYVSAREQRRREAKETDPQCALPGDQSAPGRSRASEPSQRDQHSFGRSIPFHRASTSRGLQSRRHKTHFRSRRFPVSPGPETSLKFTPGSSAASMTRIGAFDDISIGFLGKYVRGAVRTAAIHEPLPGPKGFR